MEWNLLFFQRQSRWTCHWLTKYSVYLLQIKDTRCQEGEGEGGGGGGKIVSKLLLLLLLLLLVTGYHLSQPPSAVGNFFSILCVLGQCVRVRMLRPSWPNRDSCSEDTLAPGTPSQPGYGFWRHRVQHRAIIVAFATTNRGTRKLLTISLLAFDRF